MTLDTSKLSGARSFFDIVAILKLVAAAASDFFDDEREKDKAARFIADLVRNVSDYLNAALASLTSNHPLLETCAPDVILAIRTTPAADLRLLAVLEVSLDSLLTLHTSGSRKSAIRVALAANALKLVQLQQSPPTATRYGYSSFGPPALAPNRAPAPPPTFPSAGTRPGTLPGQGNRACRFTDGNACALCGKGSTPGSVGHRASSCPASDSEIDNWVHNAVPVI